MPTGRNDICCRIASAVTTRVKMLCSGSMAFGLAQRQPISPRELGYTTDSHDDLAVIAKI
jgi:hypothetical protein